MYRRKFIKFNLTVATVILSGCIGDNNETQTKRYRDDITDSSEESCEDLITARNGPALPYDLINLSPVSDSLINKSESVILEYEDIGPDAQRIVDSAVNTTDSIKQCRTGNNQTGVMALYSDIKNRWSQTDTEAPTQTYLYYKNKHYSILIVHEGDVEKINSGP